MKGVLMVAFHAPPFASSTGRLRTLSFARHLPSFGWQPTLLTAKSSVYPQTDAESLAELPDGMDVLRAPGLDAARHLALRGAYPQWLATPDRWSTWALAAAALGVIEVHRRRPNVVWATFPIPSALLAAWIIRRLTGAPLVADLRDPIVYEDWPADPWSRRVYAWLERRVVTSASAVAVTTPGARRLYLDRYPQLPESRFVLIPNGVEDDVDESAPEAGGHGLATSPMTLVHSGLMEHPDRDPTAFFEALASLKAKGLLPATGLRVTLRATGRDSALRSQVASCNLSGIVDIAPHVPRHIAVEEMRCATGLLLFQGRHCNRQIPAKAYEYLAAGRPILGLLDRNGDTCNLVADAWKVPYIADMANAGEIERMLRQFVQDATTGSLSVPDKALVEKYSRRSASQMLAELLDTVSAADTPAEVR